MRKRGEGGYFRHLSGVCPDSFRTPSRRHGAEASVFYSVRGIEGIKPPVLHNRCHRRETDFFFMSRRSRRLDDRIRQLCERVSVTQDPEELELILPELQAALHEAIERLRIRAVAVLTGDPDIPDQRRKLG